MIKIKEVLPNPVGVDRLGEYIILVNDGDEAVSLTNWKIKDKSGKEFSLSGYVIAPGSGLEFSANVTGIILNNSDELIELLGPDGGVEDSLSYTGAIAEGQVVLHGAQLSDEVYDELFDELAGSGEGMVINSVAGLPFQFWLVLVLLGVVLATTGAILLKYLSEKN